MYSIAKLNEIKNDKLLKVRNYEFIFISELNMLPKHPMSEYYLKVEDLSINLYVGLKGSLGGYYFMSNIRQTFESSSLLCSSTIPVEPTCDKFPFYLDDFNLDVVDFKDLMEGEYNEAFYEANSKIRFKLKLDVHHFLWLGFVDYPSLMRIP